MTNELANIESVIMTGNLASLTAQQKIFYHNKICELVGLNPLTKPFEYITFQGKTVLYAGKNCAEQLRKIHNISLSDMTYTFNNDMAIVTVKARTPDGREDTETAAISIAGLKGDAHANALMKVSTKAKRRVTLSICGLGMLDESELDTIPEARKALNQKIEAPQLVGTSQVMPKENTPNGFINLSEEVDTPPFNLTPEPEVQPQATQRFEDPEWSLYRFMYALPPGPKFAEARELLKSTKAKWRPGKDKNKNDIPGGNNCWYSDIFIDALEVYCKENPEYAKSSGSRAPFQDDVNF